jgi:hypothetical protein
MNALLRRITFLLLGLTAALALAGPANAATSQVKFRNQVTGSKLMTKEASGLVSMKTAGLPGQIWTKTDTTLGYATYSQGTGCLTGRGLQGAPVVTVEHCTVGNTAQEWRLGPTGDLQLRKNGLVAEVNTANASLRVQMAFFAVKPNQKWFRLAA